MTLAEFFITIVIKKAFEWHHLRSYVARNVEHLLTGLRWVIVDILGLILSKKLESKLVLFRAFEGSSKSSENLCGQEKKALAI